MRGPTGMVFDSDGSMIFSDTFNQRIRRIGTDGKVTTIAGDGRGGFGGDGGPALQASFWQPYGLAIDANRNIYVADDLNRRVRKINQQQGMTITTYAGNGDTGSTADGGQATGTRLGTEIYAVAYDNASNVLYIADLNERKIWNVSPGGTIRSIPVSGAPSALMYDAGARALYFSEFDTDRVWRRDVASGAIFTVAGKGAAGF